ncbi:MAG: hypothetical protein HC829_01930 [Bacteroidales bacterium]|nr:hypothetical protein [Bacteroidales bacterium]
MTDEEIRQAWAWDPDMTWPTDEELAEFDLVIPAKGAARDGRRPRSREERSRRSEGAEAPAAAAPEPEPAKPKDAAE